MFITKTALPRRTFLRGVGVTLALPLLDAMVPALTAMAKTAAAPVRRLGCIYHGNGTIHRDWIPATTGKGFELSPILKPLAAVKDQLVVISGLDHHEADSKGDGNNDHPRATAVWLSGVHAYTLNDSSKAEARLGTTVDQIAANTLGKDTPLLSLQFSLEDIVQGSCDSGDCFYSNTISWRTPTTPLSMETHPRVVFERLFGDGANPAQRLAQTRKTGTLLDSVTQEVASLQKRLGASDRGKLTEYLESVREIEQRIATIERRGILESADLPEVSVDIPGTWDDRAKVMLDLQVLAFQADVTRVFSMVMARENSPTSYPDIGVPEQHHSLSHHMNNPNLMAKKAKIDTHLIGRFAYLLEKLRASPDGDGTLLDHSLLLYGGGIGNPNLHEHTNLPCLLAGGSAGRLQGDRHLQFPAGTPKANVFMNMLDMLGVPTPDQIGDSNGRLTGL
jgi:hypothetical protein